MSKLYYKYGVMGSSKSANLLMTRHNYEQKGFETLVLKSCLDTRDMVDNDYVIKSRIGLQCNCKVFDRNTNLVEYVKQILSSDEYKTGNPIIMVDEAQFCTTQQIEQLKRLTLAYDVLCYGLLTDFKSELFEGSKRLVELADSMQELKTVCKCGRKANINARLVDGKIVTTGDQIQIGGDESYESMCYNCWTNDKDKVM